MSEIISRVVNEIIPDPPHAFTRDQRWTLVGVGVVAYFATHFLFDALPLFRSPGFGGSLLLDANPIIALTAVVVWSAVVYAGGTWSGRGIRPDVGLFAVAIALFALRRTGGLSRDVYLDHPAAPTLWTLSVELVLIAALLGLLQYLTRRLIAGGSLRDDAALDGIRPTPEPVGQKLLATLTHALVFSVIVLITVRSDARMQVAGMLAAASLVASACTVRFIPATPAGYFWLGPVVAGLIGYAVTALTGTANLAIGEPAGYCASLARALPLDFVSAGVAGSLYGYWMGRAWIPEDALERPAR